MDKTNLREEIAGIASQAFAATKGGPGWDLAIADALLPLLTAAKQEGFREGIERAAKVAEQHGKDAVTIDALIAESIASAIRALQPTKAEP